MPKEKDLRALIEKYGGGVAPTSEATQEDKLREIVAKYASQEQPQEQAAPVVNPEAPPEQRYAEKRQAAYDSLPSAEGILGTAMEGVAGFNRGLLKTGDFLISDTINAGRELLGVEDKVPTLEETFAAPKGSFSDSPSGRVVADMGEAASSAVGAVGALRGAAGSILTPLARQSESTAKGMLRSAAEESGRVTVGLGAIAGGAETAAKEAGASDLEAGIAGLAAGVLSGAVLAKGQTPVGQWIKEVRAGEGTDTRGLEQLLDGATVSTKQLKDKAEKLFTQVSEGENRILLTAKEVKSLKNSIDKALDGGINRVLDPKDAGSASIREIRKVYDTLGVGSDVDESSTLGFKQLQYLNQSLRDYAQGLNESGNKSVDAGRASKALGEVDRIIKKHSDANPDKNIQQTLNAAKDTYARQKMSENLERTMSLANKAFDSEKGRKRYIADWEKIVRNNTNGKGVPIPDDVERQIVDAGRDISAAAVARVMKRTADTISAKGRFASMSGAAGVTQLLPIFAATKVAGDVALAQGKSFADTTANRLYRNISQGMYKRNDGENVAKKILEAYLRNTPKKERSSEELAKLFVANRVPVDSINMRKSSPIMSQAGLITAVAYENLKSALDSNQDQTSPVGELQP